MKKYLIKLIVILSFVSCNFNNKGTKTPKEQDVVKVIINEDSVIQGKQIIEDSIRLEQQRIQDSIKIVKKVIQDSIINAEHILFDSALIESVRGLSIVQNIWENDTICSFDDIDHITTLRQLTDTSLIVVTFKHAIYNEYRFYEISINGDILHDTLLPYCNYPDISDENNFEVNEHGNVYYMLDYDSKEIYNYSALSKSHELIDYKMKKNKYRFPSSEPEFISPDEHYTIILDLHELKLRDNNNGILYELISANKSLNNLEWCFGIGSWNDESTKFYFDNSGEVACIWEINLDKQTLDKIIPEHEARLPICIGNTVYFVENRMIRKTNYIETKQVLKQGLGIQEALIDEF